MWLWLKTLVAKLMVAAGIDWPNMADGDKLNAVVGMGIGLIGVVLGVLAFRLSRRQAVIAETQHAVWQGMQEQVVTLIVDGHVKAEDDANCTIVLAINNIGTRGTLAAYWHLMIPEAEMSGVDMSPRNRTRHEPVTLDDGRRCLRWNGLQQEPIFKKRRVTLAVLTIDKASAADRIHVLWTLSADEGEFPQPEKAEEIKIAELTIRLGKGSDKTTIADEDQAG